MFQFYINHFTVSYIKYVFFDLLIFDESFILYINFSNKFFVKIFLKIFEHSPIYPKITPTTRFK